MKLIRLQPVDKPRLSPKGDIVAECEGAYLRKSRTDYALVVEGVNNIRYFARRKGNFDDVLERANQTFIAWTNPDGIFCLECGEYCYLSEDGKRWLCRNEAHN